MTLEVILRGLGAGFLSLERGFLFGPQGRLIRRNFEELWFRNCVIMPSYNIFMSSSDRIFETLEGLQATGAADRPVGIAVLEESKNTWNTEVIESYTKLNCHRIGKVSIITDSSEGKDLYHRKQRERKVWWRKFAREPSRFMFTEAKKLNKNRDSIEIIARFPFGNVTVETISYQQDVRKFNTTTGTDNTQDTQIVEHTTSLDWGCLAFLCDAYDISPMSTIGQLKLNLKLSPYKVGFHVPPSTSESDLKSQERARLTHYLNNLLKSKGVETVITKSRQAIDCFQVPLVVTVDDSSLQNGIVQVWSQLSTLAESVHITDLAKYVQSRF